MESKMSKKNSVIEEIESILDSDESEDIESEDGEESHDSDAKNNADDGTEDDVFDDEPNFGMAMIAKTWKELEKPKNGIVIVEEDENGLRGKYYAEPLERGYGHTLGTALKKIMLNSIKGCAIVAYKVKSSWTMTDRDKNDLELNLKSLVLWTQSPTLMLEITLKNTSTQDEFKAADLQLDKYNIFVPDGTQNVCDVPKGEELTLTLLVRSGYSYVLRKNHKDIPDGMIALDSMFCPIQRVDVHVSNARVGQRTDYNRLTLEVWSNGIVPPREAIVYAAKRFKEQMQFMINFEEDKEEPIVQQVHAPQKAAYPEALYKRLSELQLSVRASNCLKTIGIQYIGELVQKTENDMLKTKNFGKKSLTEIRDILKTHHLQLGTQFPGWTPNP